MRQLPSRFRRLDDALAALPLDEPMLLTELDGFLTGVVLCPDPILSGEWLQSIWGSGDNDDAPFEDPADVQWFADAVMARFDEIVRDLGRGKPQPIFAIDDRNGDVLWEFWIDGFAQAMALRPESWAPLAEGEDRGAAEAISRMSTLIDVACNESAFDSMQINAIQDQAPSDLNDNLLELYAARRRNGGFASTAQAGERPGKIGRNDPCRCGSGKKFKRCCG